MVPSGAADSQFVRKTRGRYWGAFDGDERLSTDTFVRMAILYTMKSPWPLLPIGHTSFRVEQYWMEKYWMKQWNTPSRWVETVGRASNAASIEALSGALEGYLLAEWTCPGR